MDKNELKKLVEEEKLERLANCKKELDEVLTKYRCTFEPVAIIKPNVYPQITLHLQVKD